MSNASEKILYPILASVVASIFVSVCGYFLASSHEREIQKHSLDQAHKEIAEIKKTLNKTSDHEARINMIEKRLDTYEQLVIKGQKEISAQMTALTVNLAKASTEIGAIKTDITEIKDKINR